MQRKSNLIELLGLLIGAASLALALADQDGNSVQPINPQAPAYLYDDPYGYSAPPAPRRHRYHEYYEPCDPHYCGCECY